MGTSELGWIIALLTLIFGVLKGGIGMARTKSRDTKENQATLTTVIVKLENIGNDVSTIKSDLKNISTEVRDNRDKIIKLGESVKQAHKRIDKLEEVR